MLFRIVAPAPIPFILIFSVAQITYILFIYLLFYPLRIYVPSLPNEEMGGSSACLPPLKAKLGRRVLMQKERGLFRCCACRHGKWGTPCFKAHPLHKTRAKSNHPQQNRNQSQCPEFLLHFKVLLVGSPTWLLCGHPGRLACSQLLFGVRLPHKGCFWGGCGPMSYAPVKEWMRGRGGDNILLPNGPPLLLGSPILGLPCPPPGNDVSQCQRLVKRKGIIYSKVIQT